MFHIQQSDGSLLIALASTREELRFALNAALEYASKASVGQAPVTVVLRELLLNAMEHGNKGVAHRLIQCLLQRSHESGLVISVKDAVEGFDYHAIDLTIPENPQGLKHRGLKLVSALTDHMEFTDLGKATTTHISHNRSVLSTPPPRNVEAMGGAA